MPDVPDVEGFRGDQWKPHLDTFLKVFVKMVSKEDDPVLPRDPKEHLLDGYHQWVELTVPEEFRTNPEFMAEVAAHMLAKHGVDVAAEDYSGLYGGGGGAPAAPPMEESEEMPTEWGGPPEERTVREPARPGEHVEGAPSPEELRQMFRFERLRKLASRIFGGKGK